MKFITQIPSSFNFLKFLPLGYWLSYSVVSILRSITQYWLASFSIFKPNEELCSKCHFNLSPCTMSNFQMHLLLSSQYSQYAEINTESSQRDTLDVGSLKVFQRNWVLERMKCLPSIKGIWTYLQHINHCQYNLPHFRVEKLLLS